MLEYIDTEWGKAWVSSQFHARRGVFLPLVYIDINGGNLMDALVFAQIMYWHEPNRETGKSRLRIFQDGQWWMAKNHGDWWREVRVNKRMARSSLERIRDRGLIVYELHGHAGKSTPYIRVNWVEFERAIKAAMEPDGLLTPPDSSGDEGEDAAENTPYTKCTPPARGGTPPVHKMYSPRTQSVKSNTEINKDSSAEKGEEKQAPGWMAGPVPIPKLLLLPPPKINAEQAVEFFGKNIGAVNPHLRETIAAACQVHGLQAVMAALADAAAHNAKGWAYVVTILERKAREAADTVARAEAHRAAVAQQAVDEAPPLNPLPKTADGPVRVPTQSVVGALEVMCPGHGGTAAKTWDMVHFQLELQLDQATFNTYIRDLRLADYRADTVTFVVMAPSEHGRDMCTHRLGRQVKKLLGEVCEQAVQVEFVCEEKRGAA